MTKSIWTFALVVILLVTGCSQNSGITYTPPALEDGWSVKFMLSGGFDGLTRNIEIRSDGSFTFTDARDGNSSEGKISQDELETLEGLVAEFEFHAPETPSGCADCFLYQVEIESGGRKMIAEADDVTLGDSGMGPLVQFLRGIMDTALK